MRAEILDFTEPVAVFFMGVLGHIADSRRGPDARATRSSTRVPSGSYLAIADGTPTEAKPESPGGVRQSGAVPYRNREPEEIASFFEGLEWVEPGFVSVSLWRPDAAQRAADRVAHRLVRRGRPKAVNQAASRGSVVDQTASPRRASASSSMSSTIRRAPDSSPGSA